MQTLRGILFGMLLVFALYQSYQAYKWKKVADRRGWQAEQAFSYLAEPVFTAPDGSKHSRAEMLDLLFRQLTTSK